MADSSAFYCLNVIFPSLHLMNSNACMPSCTALQTPHEASAPTSSWRGAFLGSAFYFLTAVFPSPLRILSTAEASALLLTLFVGHR